MILFNLPILFLSLLFAHDFHVSVTNAEYKEDVQELQISIKVFTDDLEDALSSETGARFSLKEAGKNKEQDSVLSNYIQAKFQVLEDQEPLPMTYIGHEIELDICFIYMLVSDFPVEKELEIRNIIFFDRFEDQSNIVNIRVHEKVYSLFLDPHHPVKKVRFD